MRSEGPSTAGRGCRRGLRLLALAALILLGIARPASAQTFLFADFPRGEVFPDSTLRIVVAAIPPARAPDSCALFQGPVPAGTRLDGHPARIRAARSRTPDSTGWIFAFKPQDYDSGQTGPQLGIGFHYVLGYCGDGKTTPEAPLWVATRQAPTILAPKAQETSSSPTLAWTPVPGVPAYHLLLSDQAINIDPAKGTVSGASIIWQAITTQTSLAYGTPDPSGNFSRMPAPPLSPGVPYNLVILDNYDGRSALASSSKAQALKLFTIQPPGPILAPPKNLSPAPGKTLSMPQDSVITFTWNRAQAAAGGAAANTYQLFVYSLEAQGGLDVLIPIWRSEVTDTTARLDARRVLLTRRYVWKVFAISDAGAGTVGDTTSFLYRNDVQTLSVKVKSTADSQVLADVRVAIAPADGGADPLPLFTANDGYAEKVLAAGSYSLTFAKDGFLSETRTVDLGTASVSLAIALAPAACRLTGLLADKSGASLANATATATGGGRTVTAQTDARGFFLLGVPPGTYAVSFAKPDYQSRPDTTVTLAAGKDADLGKLVMAQAQAALTGTVANDKGVALAACDVTIKTAAGAFVRALRSDDKGSFSAFLSPGAYTVTAARAGFASDTKAVQLTEAASLAFSLTSGASLIKGRVSMLSWSAPGAPQSAPAPGATVELFDRIRGGSQRAEADLRGEFSFSADTGVYLARASRPGKGLPDSAVLRVAAQRSTYGADLALRGFASVQGTLHVTPDTVLDPASVTVSLLDAATLSVAATAVPQPALLPGEAGAMAYSLDGVPDGTYHLSCGVRGYGLDAEPTVSIKDGVWRTGQDLTLKKATKTLTFAFAAGGSPVKGVVNLITPQAAQTASGAKFGPTAAGTYTLDAIPDSADLIPLSRYAFFLPAAGTRDTLVNLAFPFAHHPVPLTFSDGEAELTLQAEARLDSVQIIYGYGAPVDTFRVPAEQLSGPIGLRGFKFRPGPQGGRLNYGFRIRTGALIYSNTDPAHRFQADVAPSPDLAFLKLASGDSLRLPARTKSHLYLHAYDAAGRRLDSAIDARGEIHWQADSALSMKLDKRSMRTLTYQTSGPSAGAERRPAAKRGAARRSADAGWDTLRVTVTLDGVAKTLSLPARVVDARANKIVLTSGLGQTDRLNAPEPFGLFVSAFDTTLTPPLPLAADPVFSLDPAEAGSVAEMRVLLDPRFIGPLRVIARQANPDGSETVGELGAERDSADRGLNVGQTVRAGDSARLFFHDKRFELRVPDSAFADKPQATLRLFRRNVAKSFASGLDYAVDGPLWEISNPAGAAFGRKPRLTLGIPSGDRAHTLKRFDVLKLDWMALADSAVADTNSFGLAALSADIADLDGSYYGLLGASRPLSAGAVSIIPNPFSPLVMASRDGNSEYGTRIRVEPESDRSSEVTLTLKIYTLDGELLRTLVDHKTVPKGPADFYWDGKADGGRWARNGRYLLEVAVNATGSTRTRYSLKPVVVFR